MIDVDLAPEVLASLRAMKDRGTRPRRCHKGPIRNAIAGGMRRLVENDLAGGVRPWDLPAIQRHGDRGVLLTGRDDSALVIEG